MADSSLKPPETCTATVKLDVAGRSIEMQITVPSGPTRPAQLLPLLQSLTDAVVDIAGDIVAEQGKTISCKAGCGACCRQLVPISQSEARRIAELIERLPEPRRAEIRRRFAAAEERLAAAGLLETLRETKDIGEDALRAIGMDYFRLGVACPFLEDESCSIHRDRPLSCREYLVTSPAEHCRRPAAATIDRVSLPVKVSGALLRVERGGGAELVPWVPLVVAPQWAESHPDGPPGLDGPELTRQIFQELSGRKVPSAEGPRGGESGN
jgi:Fe-S-cluster containining protein